MEISKNFDDKNIYHIANKFEIENSVIELLLIFFKKDLHTFIYESENISIIYKKGFLSSLVRTFNSFRKISQYEYSVFCYIYYFKILNYNFIEKDVPVKWMKKEIDKCILKKDINVLFFFDRILTTEQFNTIDSQIIDIKLKLKKSLVNIGINQLQSLSDFHINKNKNKKICIVAGLFQHSPKALHAQLVKNYAESLLDHDKECQVVVVNTNEIPFKILDFNFKYFRMEEKILKVIDELYFPMTKKYSNRFEFFNLRPKLEYHQDMSYVIKVISQINPDILMFYGSPEHNESYLIRKIFYNYRPTIYFFSQLNNRVDEDNDIYFARSKSPLVGKYDRNKVIYAPNPIGKDYSNEIHEQYIIAKPKNNDDVYLISVLSGDRLYHSIKNIPSEYLQKIFDILEKGNIKWFFVGVENKDLFYELDGRFKAFEEKSKIIFIKMEKNLLGLLELCDIFVHFPNITGGGGGVTMAVAKKLVVLNSYYNDGAVSLPENLLFDKNDFEGFFNLLMNVIVDSSIRNKLKKLCYQHYLNRDQRERMKNIFNGFDLAIDNFNKRIKK